MNDDSTVRAVAVSVPSKCCMTCDHYLLTSGICRRFPPQVIVKKRDGEGNVDYLSVFPPMRPEGVCGEWRGV